MNQPVGKRVTLVDVARLAKVDKAVVSRVVNHDQGLVIRPETRARVEAAIAKLGYRTNQAARSLRTAQSGSLGLVIPDFSNPVYAEIIAGAEAEAARRGYVLMAGSSSGVGGSINRYLDLLGDGRVDGLLVAGGRLTAADQEAFERLSLPWLMVNNRTRTTHRYVVLNDIAAAGMAVDHLADLGHTSIGHIAGPRGSDTARRRAAGFRKQADSRGLSVSSDLVHHGDYTPIGGRRAVDALIATGVPFTALVIANIASAIGVLNGLAAAGLSVPADVSVVAIHDLSLAAHLSPPLTTVSMPLRKLGARAVELILSRPADEAIDEMVDAEMALVRRDSTRRLPEP